MSNEHKERLEGLPSTLCLAVAARCGRRLQPLVNSFLEDSSSKDALEIRAAFENSLLHVEGFVNSDSDGCDRPEAMAIAKAIAGAATAAASKVRVSAGLTVGAERAAQLSAKVIAVLVTATNVSGGLVAVETARLSSEHAGSKLAEARHGETKRAEAKLAEAKTAALSFAEIQLAEIQLTEAQLAEEESKEARRIKNRENDAKVAEIKRTFKLRLGLDAGGESAAVSAVNCLFHVAEALSEDDETVMAIKRATLVAVNADLSVAESLLQQRITLVDPTPTGPFGAYWPNNDPAWPQFSKNSSIDIEDSGAGTDEHAVEADTLTIEVSVPKNATKEQIADAIKQQVIALDQLHKAHGFDGIEIDDLQVERSVASEVPQS